MLAVADKVLRVDGPSPWLAHLELQASRDRLLPVRLLQYHALLLHRHELPVASTVVLLRPEASGRELTGHFDQAGPAGPAGDITLQFRYSLMRIWERPAEELLTGGLGIAPLAPLAAITPAQLPEVLERLDERFTHDAPSPAAVDDLWAATLLLMGVRYHADVIRGLSERVQRMRESVTYQMIVEEGIERGEVLGMREMLVEQGIARFGQPGADQAATLDQINDVTVLRRLGRAILTADSWDALLADA